MNRTIQILMVATISLGFNVVEANNNMVEPPQTRKGGYPTPPKCPKPIKPATITYDATSTALAVKFSATSGEKIEIYRNGSKIVNAIAAAGETLYYTLRNYGKGNYSVIVSSGNNLIYSATYTIK